MSGAINFYNEEIEYRLVSIKGTRAWLNRCIEQEGKTAGDISYIFCNDEYLYRLNSDYLKHDAYTDIITFDYSEGERVSGDIFISIERVKENASIYGVPFRHELNRVMVHGILHLCGYKDKTKKQSELMRKKEDEYLALFV